jgi:hypothetical protein
MTGARGAPYDRQISWNTTTAINVRSGQSHEMQRGTRHKRRDETNNRLSQPITVP